MQDTPANARESRFLRSTLTSFRILPIAQIRLLVTFFCSDTSRRVLKRTRFASDVDLQAAVTSWFFSQTPEFYVNGIRKVIKRWMKCINLNGDYVEV